MTPHNVLGNTLITSHSAVWPYAILIRYASRQAVAWRFAAAKICVQTYIDRITENNGCLAAPANKFIYRRTEQTRY